jgi:preprotein translocase subunit YajC
MFGFPFFTSLIVTVAMVVGFSFIINHGIQKKKANNEDAMSNTSQGEKDTNCHA